MLSQLFSSENSQINIIELVEFVDKARGLEIGEGSSDFLLSYLSPVEKGLKWLIRVSD